MTPEGHRSLCVVGGHRCGTSMVMRVLHEAGVHLGAPETILGASESNELGHYENRDLIAVNDALLEHFGGSWDSPPELSPGWESDPALEPMRERARAVLAGLAEHPVWGWKDPRTTLLIPFWTSLVDSPRFLVCLRSPLAAARSLEKRNGIPLRRGVELWTRYALDALRGTSGFSRRFLFYEDFLADPRGEIARLLAFVGLEPSAAERLARDGVVARLEHHPDEPPEVLRHPEVGSLAPLVHLGLRALQAEARARKEEGDGKAMSESADALADLLARLRDELDRAPLEAELARCVRSVGELRAALAREREAARVREDGSGERAPSPPPERTLPEPAAAPDSPPDSLALSAVQAFWRGKERLFPTGSRRRRGYDFLLRGLKALRRRGLGGSLLRALQKMERRLSRPFSEPVLARESAIRPRPSLPPSDELPPVDVIVVTYNSADSVERCLRSVWQSDYPAGRISVIVVDNDSSDDSLAVVGRVAHGRPEVRVLRNVRNVGFGRAVNRGVEAGSGRYVLLLNPDAVLARHTLATLVAHAEDGMPRGFRAWEARQEPFEHPKLYDPVTLRTEWCSGACTLLSRDAFGEVSGFDPNLFLYGEDVDLSWRLRARGHELQYVPRAVVRHDTYASAGEIKPAQFFHSVVSNGILRHKHGSLRDIAAYPVLYAECVLAPPELPRVRRRLLANVLHAPRLLRALADRSSRRGRAESFRPRFDRWDYEVRRSGAYHRTGRRAAEPRVSVIVRTKARPGFLREALQSLRNQTYPNLEVVVVEDGPSESAGVVAEFADLRIRYESTGSSIGRAAAGNVALALATGEYCNFLDDDDLLFADHCEVLVGELEGSATHRAAYGVGLEVPTTVLSEDPLRYRETGHRITYRTPFDRERLEAENYIPINCVLFHRSLFLEAGGFDTELELLEDWELWVRYARRTDFAFVDKTTALYRVPGTAEEESARHARLHAAYESVSRRIRECAAS